MDELRKQIELLQGTIKDMVAKSTGSADEIQAIKKAQDDLGAKFQALSDEYKKRSSQNLPGLTDEKQKFNYAKAIKGVSTGQWDNAGFEKDVFDQTRKAMSSVTGADGGYWIPAEYSTKLIELAVADTASDKLGVTVLSGLTGSTVYIPKETGEATFYWIGENTQITDSKHTAGQLALTPNKASGLVIMPNELISDSNPSASDIVQRRITNKASREIDRVTLIGSGNANEPTGIVNQGSINTVAIDTDGGRFNFKQANLMKGKLRSSNTYKGKLGFAMHPDIITILENTRPFDNTSGPSGAWDVYSEAEVRAKLGWDFATSSQIPTDLTKNAGTALTYVILANWEDVIQAFWQNIQLAVSDQRYFEYDQLAVRVIFRMDVGLANPKSVCVISDATTT